MSRNPALGCVEFLAQYNQFLSARGGDGSGEVRARPVFFTGENCTGQAWPALGEFTDDGGSNAFQNPNQAGGNVPLSGYIPRGWRLAALKGSGPPLTTVLVEADHTSSRIATNEDEVRSLINFGAGEQLQGVANLNQQASATNPLTFSPTCWKLQACGLGVAQVLGGFDVETWQPGSPECDAFMTSWCDAGVGGQACPLSDGGSWIPEPSELCVCRQEEAELRDSDAGLASLQGLGVALPVACFGQRCSSEGYRWAPMRNQRCDVTLCKQVSELTGELLDVDVSADLWCGNAPLAFAEEIEGSADSAEPVALPVPGPATSLFRGGATDWSVLSWVVLAVAFLLLLVAPVLVWFTRGAPAGVTPPPPPKQVAAPTRNR